MHLKEYNIQQLGERSEDDQDSRDTDVRLLLEDDHVRKENSLTAV